MNREQIINNILLEATGYLEAAQEEWCRPEEDVVSYMVCLGAYKSVEKYLSAYLFKRGHERSEMEPLEIRLKACCSQSPAFNDLNLEPLFYGNAHHTDTAWVDFETMKVYLNLAKQTRALVEKEIK